MYVLVGDRGLEDENRYPFSVGRARRSWCWYPGDGVMEVVEGVMTELGRVRDEGIPVEHGVEVSVLV